MAAVVEIILFQVCQNLARTFSASSAVDEIQLEKGFQEKKELAQSSSGPALTYNSPSPVSTQPCDTLLRRWARSRGSRQDDVTPAQKLTAQSALMHEHRDLHSLFQKSIPVPVLGGGGMARGEEVLAGTIRLEQGGATPHCKEYQADVCPVTVPAGSLTCQFLHLPL